MAAPRSVCCSSAGRPVRVRALCPDVVGTRMVTARAAGPGAALLFAGPKPMDEDAVARAEMALMDSRQIFRVMPRWRGALVRGVDPAPAFGLSLVALMRKLGDRRQAGGRPSTSPLPATTQAAIPAPECNRSVRAR